MSSLTVNLEEIKDKLIEKLRPNGWADKLKGFVQSSDFDELIQKLIDAKDSGKRFTPPLKHVFRAFEECPFNDIRVVIIGQDPYPQLNVADGLAFSCSLTGVEQPSLQYIFEAIQKTVYPDSIGLQQDPDLKRWADQGVLLLNSALTTEVGKPATQYDIWYPFLVYVLDQINAWSGSTIFILMGKKAHEFEDLLGTQHHIFKISHPASAAYNGKVWDSQDVFNKVNQLLTERNGKEFQIKW